MKIYQSINLLRAYVLSEFLFEFVLRGVELPGDIVPSAALGKSTTGWRRVT